MEINDNYLKNKENNNVFSNEYMNEFSLIHSIAIVGIFF